MFLYLFQLPRGDCPRGFYRVELHLDGVVFYGENRTVAEGGVAYPLAGAEVVGGGRGEAAAHPERENPEPLCEILAAHGLDDFFVVGLADDEIGYIVPPDDFLVDESAPYLEAAKPADGSRHYEETNSVGRDCADAIADALRELLREAFE